MDAARGFHAQESWVPEIEVEIPDLDPWSAGNTGLAYTWTFEAARAGPHILLQALTHGRLRADRGASKSL